MEQSTHQESHMQSTWQKMSRILIPYKPITKKAYKKEMPQKKCLPELIFRRMRITGSRKEEDRVIKQFIFSIRKEPILAHPLNDSFVVSE